MGGRRTSRSVSFTSRGIRSCTRRAPRTMSATSGVLNSCCSLRWSTASCLWRPGMTTRALRLAPILAAATYGQLQPYHLRCSRMTIFRCSHDATLRRHDELLDWQEDDFLPLTGIQERQQRLLETLA